MECGGTSVSDIHCMMEKFKFSVTSFCVVVEVIVNGVTCTGTAGDTPTGSVMMKVLWHHCLDLSEVCQ